MTLTSINTGRHGAEQRVNRLFVTGRYLVVRVLVDGFPLYLHNVYAPVDRQKKFQFFSGLVTEEFEDHATHIVSGDLNTPLDPRLDSSTPDLRYDPGRSSCLEWMAKLGVVVAWRIHFDTKRVFTGLLPRKNRLDYILISESFSNDFYGDSRYFLPQHAGDHLAHKAEIVRDRLRSASNPGTIWESWKLSIKSQLQAVQKKLRLQDTQAIAAARIRLNRAAARFRGSSCAQGRDLFDAAMLYYKKTATRTSQYNQDDALDFQAANFERSTKYFFRPLDTSLRRVSIEEALTPDGSLSTNPTYISQRFLEHWVSEMGDPTSPAGLGPPPHAAFQLTLLNTVVRSVSSLDLDILDAPVTATDLAAAIRHMRATSSPGMDGLTAGFYQVAPDVFGDCLSIVFKDRLHRGTLLPFQRKSAVVLLHKKGSRAAPGNYRPIALVQVDVNILSPPTDLLTGRNDEAYAMFLDFEIAFDRVNWDYMFRLLERMGFGPTFTRWIRLLYTDPRAHLMINQNIQPALFPTRSVKQRDPLSSLLFILTIEPLSNLLRKH
uniref:Reverse transcriptase domain-containing protein n=1 Tax=Peronospora matthiolae TaxID=2874970 RepID=A0AAV1V4S1_9STRA